jgi:hypothetical protein
MWIDKKRSAERPEMVAGSPPRPLLLWSRATCGEEKADVAEHPEVFHHVGLLINKPPGMAEVPFI